MNKKQIRFIKDWINSLLFALFFAFLFQTFLYQPFKIPSGSMEPNLLIGDYLFVEKFAYGYNNSSLSFWVSELNLTDKKIVFKKPQRGDVIVFNIDADNKHYIKRIIGLPGDRVRIQQGEVYINSAKVQRTKVSLKIDKDNRRIIFKETLPNGVTYNIYKNANSDNKIGYSDDIEYIVPADSYFCMGDNRDNSRDSRYLSEMGYIKESKIIGKAKFLFFTEAAWKSFRTDRVFTLIK